MNKYIYIVCDKSVFARIIIFFSEQKRSSVSLELHDDLRQEWCQILSFSERSFTIHVVQRICFYIDGGKELKGHKVPWIEREPARAVVISLFLCDSSRQEPLCLPP